MDLFPTPDAVFAKFAESAIAEPRKRRRFLSLLNLFGITSYAEKKRQKMIALAERDINPFDIDTVPNNFSGIYAEFGVSILFEKMNDSVAQRATKLILAALAYRRSLLDGLLEKELSGGSGHRHRPQSQPVRPRRQCQKNRTEVAQGYQALPGQHAYRRRGRWILLQT